MRDLDPGQRSLFGVHTDVVVLPEQQVRPLQHSSNVPGPYHREV